MLQWIGASVLNGLCDHLADLPAKKVVGSVVNRLVVST